MLSILTLINAVFESYISSLKKDLAQSGFEVILLIVAIPWFGLLFLAVLAATGQFQLPTDSWFYIFWLGVAVTYCVQFTFFVIGLKQTLFLSANIFSKLGFIVTALYAVVLLHESIHVLQAVAIVIALLGSLLFFEWNIKLKTAPRQNLGLLSVLFSVVLSPLSGIFQKSATLHTSSYHQFLTGRIVMDTVYYSIFFLLLFAFWYKIRPLPKVTALATSGVGLSYIIITTTNSLFASWLIYKMPISTFVLLSTIGIPAGYVIGKIKYREQIESRYVFGGILIAVAIVLFATNT
jgi:drug/metabolite transporter (DMT)-like permease